jgi:alkylhydroperoxidase/carboxymuconolactone decarboxylase family protein YurZ
LEGEPAAPPGVGSGWFGLGELEAIEMHAPVREAVLTAFGLREPVDRSADILAALSSGPTSPQSVPEPLIFDDSPLAAGLDVLRTLSAGDPNAEAELRAGMPELAADILEFSMGSVWQDPALDRRTRSLLVVAMLAAQGQLASLKSHVGGALNHGATPQQIIQTLRMVAVYAGFPAAVAAWPLMEEAFAERGIPRPTGGTP